MNNIINKFLLARDKFMPEMHLRQPQFTYSLADYLVNINKEFKSLKKLEIQTICKNELDKACFAHDAAYSDSKDLTKRTAADKILRNKAFNIAKNPKYDGYQKGLASMAYKFFDKTSERSGTKLNLQLKISN